MIRRLAPVLLAALAACQQQTEPVANVATPTPAATPSPSASPRAPEPMARYVDHYPYEAVGATSFLGDPLVKAAVAAAVPDTAVRDDVLSNEAVATPIVMRDGRVLAWGCEPHNCGPHNWSIAITPDGQRAAVCYYDQDAKAARWYPEGAGPNPDSGCPSGD